MSKLVDSFFILVLHFVYLASPIESYNVVSFGAKPNGRSDSSLSFLRTWKAACNSARPSTVYVPRGTFLLKPVTFSGSCKNRITFQIQGTLVAPTDYWSMGNSGFWILFHQVSRVSILGGTIDGRGAGFWTCRRKSNNCPAGARSISFMWCNDVLVRGLTSINSQSIHMAIGRSRNMRVEYTNIRAPSGSPNTDGIHVQYSSGVTIRRSIIKTGDDCISIGPGTKNMWVERISCGPGHGISIGSLGNSLREEGVQNVTVTSSVFTKTDNGVRIKSWARASSGYATNINFRNLVMFNVGAPIIIDQTYCPNNQCPHQSSGVKISRVTYKNIRGSASRPEAITLDCSRSNPCTGIKLHNIKLSTPNKATRALCYNAAGSTRGQVIPRSCLPRQ